MSIVANLEPKSLRKEILRMAKAGNSVHVGCAFSMVEMIAVLCSGFLKADEIVEKKQDSSWLLLSKGHGVMAMYAAFYKMNLLKDHHLDQYFADGSLLHGLCEAKVPGFEISSGSLGHGLPIAVGIAYGKKIAGQKGQVYCIVGDGEMNEGPMWEALLFASHHGLANLTVIVDANGYQAMGKIDEVLKMEPFTDKFKSFGFYSVACDGHDMNALNLALRNQSPLPKVIVARTIKGKGVSFMENKNEWHYSRLSDETYQQAMKELGFT
jgi:transketolase